MKLEHFKLNDSKEVKLFCERIDFFQRSETGDAMPHIDLNLAFKKLQNSTEGGRIFTALLDLKLNFTMLYIDSIKAGGIWNEFFSPGKLEGGSVLDDQLKFNAKAKMHYHHGNFIPRYRAIWDKIMGVLILMFKPESYDKFRKAKSRKKEFKKICESISQIPKKFVENIINGIADFDQNFRTPELHGTGTIRKWSFVMLSLDETPSIELLKYWNWLLPMLSEIDRVLREMIETEE